jgi:hypothetical protein
MRLRHALRLNHIVSLLRIQLKSQRLKRHKVMYMEGTKSSDGRVKYLLTPLKIVHGESKQKNVNQSSL